MNNRWMMNRIGFVNFWLYDVEEFIFENGKLLLRGQNASGKSITTQSFIPFILDGDKTPSRLDPFGSSDRKMEYYFLGEEGKEESTGYLFIEFKKKYSEMYITIAIGQRARRGKPMDFWGFVMLDGKRIGYDFELYTEVGSNKIPLGKNEMKKCLGEGNFFTDSQSEYKRMVNKYLFGFPREEQYEQFIRLLVKVRAPKLSKEFKPTKVYEILNDSLQTLTDVDLRPMVDAMEKMDSIQANLEQLNRAMSDVKIIRNEYTRYNQFMLGRKAKAYSEAKIRATKAQAEYEKAQADMEIYNNQLQQKNKSKKDTEEKLGLIQAEIQALLDTSDLEEIDVKLDKARQSAKETNNQRQSYENRIERNRSEIRATEAEIKQLEDGKEYTLSSIEENKRELNELQDFIIWDEHEYALKLLQAKDSSRLQTIQANLRQLKDRIRQGKAAIESSDLEQRRLDEIMQKAENSHSLYEEAMSAYTYQEQHVEVIREELIRELFQKNEEHSIWILQDSELKQIEQVLVNYQIGDGRQLDSLFLESYSVIRQKLQNQESDYQRMLSENKKKHEEVQAEYDEVRTKPELQPKRNEIIEESRKKMNEYGIQALPFYKTVEFSDELSQEQCAVLESQLCDIGLLDALVVSDKDFNRIQTEYPELKDCVIHPQEAMQSDFTAFVVNTNLDADIQQAVSNILTHFVISSTKGNAQITFSYNGEYSHGILWGRSSAKESAEYVGELARKKKKECLLEQLMNQIKIISSDIEIQEQLISETKNQTTLLDDEYKNAVSTKTLETELYELKDRGARCESIKEIYLEYEKEQRNQEVIYKNTYSHMLSSCKGLPYGRTVTAYDDAMSDVDRYQTVWSSLCSELKTLENKESQISDKRDYLDKILETVDELYCDLRDANRRLQEYNIEIHHYEEILNDLDIKMQAEKLEQLKNDRKSLEDMHNQLIGDIGGLEVRIAQLEASDESMRTDVLLKAEKENLLRIYFEEELALKLVFDSEGQTLDTCAKTAISMIRKGDEEREASGVFQSLQNVFTGHSGNLVSYSTSMEECFEDAESGSNALRKRYRISSAWNGKKVFLEEFFHIIKATIEETELLIRQKDRELFEDILSKTISQQLTDRIAESRKWVADMSKLMKMDTSMGLYFALDWKPLTAESDQELDISDLEVILSRDKELLTDNDIEKVAEHFRSKIRTEKRMIEEAGLPVNYMDLVRNALDYRKWFAFRMYYYRGVENRKPLTNAAFNKFSGGEKAMAMYAPLFAAVNAQYKKATSAEHPRMIALDEAFAGVDDKNISSMFQLVNSMDFDYIMNSQALWGCYEVVDSLHIAELSRPRNSQVVTVIHYTWNGHERILNEQ